MIKAGLLFIPMSVRPSVLPSVRPSVQHFEWLLVKSNETYDSRKRHVDFPSITFLVNSTDWSPLVNTAVHPSSLLSFRPSVRPSICPWDQIVVSQCCNTERVSLKIPPTVPWTFQIKSKLLEGIERRNVSLLFTVLAIVYCHSIFCPSNCQRSKCFSW